MKEHPLNRELSIQLYQQLEGYITAKECYTNVFHSVTNSINYFKTGEWKVAYGYIRVLQDSNSFARHCFIVNKEGQAIDPTVVSLSSYREDRDYCHTSFHIFNDISEYLDAVQENSFTPDLIRPLKRIEMKTSYKWAEENGYFLMG